MQRPALIHGHCVRGGAATLALLAVATTLAACASKNTVRIDAERSPTADFYAYRTYDFVIPPPVETRDPPQGGRTLLAWHIRSVVDRQLSARGFTKASSGRPDLLVDYRLDIRDKNVETFSDYAAYRESGGKGWLTEAFVYGYQEGTVTVEIDEAATGRLIWRATASGLVDPEMHDEQVRDAVQRMFERFP